MQNTNYSHTPEQGYDGQERDPVAEIGEARKHTIEYGVYYLEQAAVKSGASVYAVNEYDPGTTATAGNVAIQSTVSPSSVEATPTPMAQTTTEYGIGAEAQQQFPAAPSFIEQDKDPDVDSVDSEYLNQLYANIEAAHDNPPLSSMSNPLTGN
jgi:hypothetical protein